MENKLNYDIFSHSIFLAIFILQKCEKTNFRVFIFRRVLQMSDQESK